MKHNKVVILNIGLNVAGVPTHSPIQVFRALYDVESLRSYAYNVAQSDTEATVSILCVLEDVEKALAGVAGPLCTTLQQDCISIWDIESGRGAGAAGWLVGPQASEWGGAFKPEYFLDLDGVLLVEKGSPDLYAARGSDDNGEPLV